MIVESQNLSSIAREIFDETLKSVDAFEAVRRAVCIEDERLCVVDSVYDLDKFSSVYSVAIGKAASRMAKALDEILEERLTAGVLSAPKGDLNLSKVWRVFHGGHPAPNEESFASARAAFELLKEANETNSPVIFLVSGGGSAMMECLRDERISLEDYQEASRVLVTCGATIAEINAIRKTLSAIKGGGLDAVLDSHIERVTLLISDTNRGNEANIASGPTIHRQDSQTEIKKIIARYDLLSRLPSSVAIALENIDSNESSTKKQSPYYVLLSNDDAIEAAAKAAERKCFIVEKDYDYIEAKIEEGCAGLIEKLFELKRKTNEPVCIISGGEFVCPVRGDGIGGRNSEAALRSAIEFSKRETANIKVAALHAGTDGIDGNSLAAGAIADETTIKRANAIGIDANNFLARSDSYNFFKPIGDTIETGATGTNVRDLRILLAS